MALVAIVRDPAAYGLTLPEIVNEPQFAVADVGGQLDLALASELAGLELDTLYSYNAGFNRWATDPAGPHRLVLPIEVARREIQHDAHVDPRGKQSQGQYDSCRLLPDDSSGDQTAELIWQKRRRAPHEKTEQATLRQPCGSPGRIR